MKSKNWQFIRAAVLCIATVMAGGANLNAASEEVSGEAALIEVLKSDAGWSEKEAACRGLRKIGTAASVPALAALLPDETLSHMARYALEPMPCPEAGQALRDALSTTTGMPKVGVIISLGARRDSRAVDLLAPLLKDSNTDIARATVGALGRIATPEAAKALMDFCNDAPEPLRPALAEGLLAAGQHLVQDGKRELAAPIYQELLAAAWPGYVQMGAFHGLVYALPDQAPDRLIEALSGDDPSFRDMAAQIVAETSGADATRRYADALASLPAGGQEALLRGLTDRKDLAAGPAVALAVQSPDRQVQLAAVKALGVLGSHGDVAALAGLLASDDAEVANAAAMSLTTMQGDGVDSSIAEAVPNAAPAVRAQLLELLAGRRAEEAVPLAVEALSDGDAPVRIAGLGVLALLGGGEHAGAVASALTLTADADERTAVEKALSAIGSRSGDEATPVVLDAMSGATPESRIVLLRVLARIGGPRPLKAVLAALDDSDAGVCEEAVRLLSNWSTLDAAPHLRDLAESNDLNRHVLGLRGYVRLARTEPSSEERTRMLSMATGLVRRTDEKKLVVAAWGTLASVESLNALWTSLDDAAVRDEAASAIVSVAAELGKGDEASKARAVEALKAVLGTCEDADIRQTAQTTLDGLN